MKRNRDMLVLAVLLLSVLLLTVLVALQEARRTSSTGVRLASASTQPSGAQALVLWLEALGFDVISDVPAEVFAVPEDTDLVFLLEPLLSITPQEWETLDAWVAEGGTLILVGEGSWTQQALRHYDVSSVYRYPFETVSTSATLPWGDNPPLATPVEARPYLTLWTERDEVAPLLTADAQPVLITFTLGEGRVVLGSIPFTFSNEGLKHEGNAELVLNLLAEVPPSGRIWFNEWHQGRRVRVAAPEGPGDWLRFTMTGRAVLYAAAVIFLGIVLQGRAFGRPVPLPRTLHRRGVLEHVTAMAQLSRRAGHRAEELRYYHHLLKRELGRRYRLDPDLPDEEYVHQLAAFDPNLDAEALRALLAGLRRSRVDEATLVRLAREAARWIEK